MQQIDSFDANVSARTTGDRVLVSAATVVAIALYVAPAAWVTRELIGPIAPKLLVAGFVVWLLWAYGRALITAEVGPEGLRFVPRRGPPISIPWSEVTGVERISPSWALLRPFLWSTARTSPSATLTGNFRIRHRGGVVAFTPDDVERFERCLERFRSNARADRS